MAVLRSSRAVRCLRTVNAVLVSSVIESSTAPDVSEFVAALWPLCVSWFDPQVGRTSSVRQRCNHAEVPPNFLRMVMERLCGRYDGVWGAIRATCSTWSSIRDAWCPMLR